MKKFLKILLIIVGIVFLIFAALICIGLFVDYDDHIENGRYTYVPEEENKGNEYIEFKLTDNGKDDSKLTYYNSIEEAILNSPLKAEHEDLSAPEDFLNHVDEILHIWNGKQYDTIFYRAGSDNDPVQGFVIARCKKQIENESTQYAFVNATPSATTPDTTYGGDFKKFIHLSLTISDIQQDLNPNYPDTRFVFGYLTAKLFGIGLREAAVKLAEDFGLNYDSRQKPSVRPRIREPTPEQKYQKGENHCYKVLTDYFHLLREWEKKYAPKQPDEEWNPLFAEALYKKNYIEYLLDILLYGSLEERKALVAEQRKEVLKLEQRIAELSADRTMHSRRNPKQLRAERER